MKWTTGSTHERLHRKDLDFVQALLAKLWAYDPQVLPTASHQLLALHGHAKRALIGLVPPEFCRPQLVKWSEELEKTKKCLQPLLQDGTVDDLQREMHKLKPGWILPPSNPAKELKALTWFFELFLFTSVELTDKGHRLREALSASLPERSEVEKLALDFLSDDFCAKSLTRKAAFNLCPTSDLSQHLLFKDRRKKELYVFRHAHILEHFEGSEIGCLFPSEFLEEVRQTLFLLFPISRSKDLRRIRRLETRWEMDVEALLGGFEPADLSSYPYFGERLCTIQQVYNASKPGKLKQWLFDRRNRLEWTALTVAVILFVLNIIFGVVQSVTGILQVVRH